MRYHEAAITTDQLVSRNYPHKARVPIRRTPGSGIWPISPIGEKSTMVDFSRLLPLADFPHGGNVAAAISTELSSVGSILSQQPEGK